MVKELIYKAKWSRFHPGAFEAYARLKANERRSLDELAAMQEELRRAVVRRAYERVPFYRERYDAAGFEPGDIGKDGWFEQLPIVTKADLRSRFEDMTDPGLRQFRVIWSTGGSTGVPTKVGVDKRVLQEVYSWRLQSWYGVDPWDDHAYIWRMTRKTFRARFVNDLLWWPTRHLKLDANMTPEMMRGFIAKYNRLKPKLLLGYVGAVTEMAKFVIENELSTWAPNVVVTTSAPITNVERELIQKAFHAPICDQYGSSELMWMAQQCPKGEGLHVNIEHVNIEYVDERNRPVPQGEYGRSLVTNLEDFVFPLIRYENGDHGRWLKDPCPCGRTLPRIDSVKGRVSEHFELPSGKIINEIFITTIFDSNPDAVRGFRVTQHKDKSITFEYIPSGYGLEAIRQVVSGFEQAVGGEVPIEYRAVDHIPHDRGKLRFVVRER